MPLQVTALKRKFKFGKLILDDIPGLTPREVAKAYASTYPELTNSSPEFEKIDGDYEVYTFEKRVGTKG